MKKNVLNRESKYSYSELNVLFNTKLQLIKRDAELLAKYEISQIDFAELEKLRTEYADTFHDPEMTVKQKEETVLKNKLNADLQKFISYVKSAMLNAVSDERGENHQQDSPKRIAAGKGGRRLH